jgi:hypothetical protein
MKAAITNDFLIVTVHNCEQIRRGEVAEYIIASQQNRAVFLIAILNSSKSRLIVGQTIVIITIVVKRQLCPLRRLSGSFGTETPQALCHNWY